MIPFHKIYLKIFGSLDFDIEKELLLQMKREEVKTFLSIKRSWLYGVLLSCIILFAILLLLINAWIWFTYFESFFASIFIPVSYIIISFFLFFDTFGYIYLYKKTHSIPTIEEDIDAIIERNKKVLKNFLKFFNISVLSSLLLFFVVCETVIFLFFFYSWNNFWLLGVEIILNIAASFLIMKHRKLSMNLELDFWLVVPGRVYIIDQTGLLSSKQSIVAQNIKTVEWIYPSLWSSVFWFGNIKFFLEGNIPQEKWIITLDYIKHPRKTIDLINKTL